MICESAVGIMVWSPWKKPRNTPRKATIATVGASIFSAMELSGLLRSVVQKKSERKNVRRPKAVPTTAAKRIATKVIFFVSFHLPWATRTEIMRETAKGRL